MRRGAWRSTSPSCPCSSASSLEKALSVPSMLAASAPRYIFGDKHLAFVRSVERFLLSHQVRALAESLVEKRFNIIVVPTRPIIIAERKTSARVENVMRLAKDVTLPPALLPRHDVQHIASVDVLLHRLG